LFALNQNLLRLTRRPWNYIAISISQLLATTLLNIYFVVILQVGIIGVFWTNLLVSSLSSVASTLLNRNWFAFSAFDRTRLHQIIMYGLPLVIGGLSMWSINYLDRYFLLQFAEVEEVGIYSVGVRLASAVSFVAWAFRLANAPFQFEVSSDVDAPKIYSRTFDYYILLLTTLCVLLSLFARPVLRILTTEAYVSAYQVIGLSAFSAAAYGLYQIVGVGLLVTKKTAFTGMAIGLGAVFNVGFLYMLIPQLGMVGAGLATLLTHVAVIIILYRGAQKAYHIPYQLGAASRVLLPAAVIISVAMLVVPERFWIDVLVSCALFVAFVVSLVLLGAIEPELRAALGARGKTLAKVVSS
jgi:O-antigen/teichoic acid export membrane protein